MAEKTMEKLQIQEYDDKIPHVMHSSHYSSYSDPWMERNSIVALLTVTTTSIRGYMLHILRDTPGVPGAMGRMAAKTTLLPTAIPTAVALYDG